MTLHTTIRAFAVTTLLALSAMAPSATAQDQTLFERLGGQPALEAVVDQFLTNVGGDDRISKAFANANMTRLRGLLVEQICSATGGPCVYTGRSMRETHAGLGVTDADFTALVEDLVAALDAFQVPAQEKGELLAILAPMQTDIVQVPAAVPSAPAPAVPVAAPPAPPSVPAAPAAAPAAVTVQGFAFNPPTIQVAVGGTVTWTNRDSVPHTATGSDFRTGPIQPGQSASATFASAGRFAYQCSIHNTMRGEIVVQ